MYMKYKRKRVNLVGGFAVIKAFEKNHPLARRDQEKSMDEVSVDVVQQNEVIAGEILKYDQQLETSRFKIYKYWLWFSFLTSTLLFSVLVMAIIEDFNGGEVFELTLFFGKVIILW